MAKGAFLYKYLADGLTPTGTSSSPASGLPWSNLNDAQPRARARIEASSAILVFDLGSAKNADSWFIGSTSLPASATARFRASTADPTCVGSLLLDTGVVANVTDPKWNGNVLWCGAPVNARYWRVDLTGANPIDIGLSKLGLRFSPARNYAFGMQEGKLDLSTRDTNPDTGAEFSVRGPVKRTRLLNFPAFSKTEARAEVEEMDRIVGASGDLLFILDPDDTWIDRAQHSIWGSYRMPGASESNTRVAFNVFSRPYRMVERL